MEPAPIVTASIAVASLVFAIAPRAGRLLAAGLLRPAVTAGAAVLVIGAASGIGPARAEVPPPPVRLVARQASSASDPGLQHTVIAGECLWRIARSHLAAKTAAEPTSADIASFWPRIYEANREIIGDDPDLILVGQVLAIPEV